MSAAGTSGGTIKDFTGLCLDVTGDDSTNGTLIQLWSCNGTDAQGWTYTGGSFVGVAGKCLDVQWASTANGTPVQLWDCNGTDAQRWTMTNGQLVGIGGKCLDVNGSNSVPGQHMQIWDCNGGQNQQFTFDASSGGASPNCTVARSGQQITDAQGNVWTVSGGVVLENGSAAGYSLNVTELAFVNGAVYQENSAGGFWVWRDGAWVGSADPVAQSCTGGGGGGPTTGSGQFVAKNGIITDPNGNVWVGRGYSITIEDIAGGEASLSDIQRLFPRTNYVRVTNFLGGGYGDGITPQSISSWVTSLTNAGIMVQFSDYGSNGNCRTGDDLAGAGSWYTGVATFYASNPWVSYETQNECYDPAGGVTQWQTQISSNYNAIRAGAPYALITLGSPGGNFLPVGQYSNSTALIDPLTNVTWDLHPYAGNPGYCNGCSQSDYDSVVANAIASWKTWTTISEGSIPVILGEFGNGYDGHDVDSDGAKAVQAGADNLSTSAVGANGVGYWLWNCGCSPPSPAADQLTSGGANATISSPFGVQVQSIIAAAPGR